jgi:hypothetical protein
MQSLSPSPYPHVHKLASRYLRPTEESRALFMISLHI